jgi:hypothetical protein
MLKEHAFIAEIEALDDLIITFQQKILKKKKVNARLLEQFKEFKALRKVLVTISTAQLSTDKILEEGDWKVLLENSKMSVRAKAAVTKVLETNKDYPKPKEFVGMVERFYVNRYTNQELYDVKTNVENYQEKLEHSIEYTLKQKGITTKETDLSASLILLLRGVIKAADVNKGTVLSKVIENAQFNSSQINLSLDFKDKTLPKVTQILNSIPLIKKWQFGIDDTVLSTSVTAIGAYKENKALQINIAKIGDDFSAAMDVFTTDINASLNKVDFGAAIAAGDGKVSFDLGVLGTFELGVKVADFSASIKEGVGFTPIQFYGKLEFSIEKHKKWFERYEELMKLVTFKIEFVVNITTSIGLKPDISLGGNIEESLKDIIKEQEDIVNKKQPEYFKKQENYNDLIERKQNIDKFKKENKALDRLIRKEKDSAKRMKLKIQKGRRRTRILKDYNIITEQLKKEGVESLGDFGDKVVESSRQLEQAIQSTIKKYDKVLLDNITKPAEKLIAELLQKQASKRLVSLLMKAVPGLNVISLAFDIYDAYTLVRDISEAYMDADTELEIDEDLEAIANSNVDINEIPEIILIFLTGIGAGGRLIELKPKDVEDIGAFLTTQFPEGDESIAFTDFMLKYGDYYDSNKNNLTDNEQFLKSLKTYNLETIAHEGQVVDLSTIDFDDPKKKVKTSSFFKTATYSIVGTFPEKVGDKIQLDGFGLDIDDSGKEHQVSFPNKKLINLVVVSIPDDETIKLETTVDFALYIDNFKEKEAKVSAKSKSGKWYTLKKGSRFEYNVGLKKFIRK